MPLRKLTTAEEGFLEFMIGQANIRVPSDWKETMMVSPMDDAGMGSLMLFPRGDVKPNRSFGRTALEFQFKDKDRIDVLASLNLDQNNELFELDIWKMNFDPLIQFPEVKPETR
jgi:hypothetical protein